MQVFFAFYPLLELSEAGFASILHDPILWAPLYIGLSSSSHQHQNSFSGLVVKKINDLAWGELF
jgi:hypothetical protein